MVYATESLSQDKRDYDVPACESFALITDTTEMVSVVQGGEKIAKRPIGFFRLRVASLTETSVTLLCSSFSPALEITVPVRLLQAGTPLRTEHDCFFLFNGSLVVATDPDAVTGDDLFAVDIIETNANYVLMESRWGKYVLPRDMVQGLAQNFYGMAMLERTAEGFSARVTEERTIIPVEAVFQHAARRSGKGDNYVSEDYPATVCPYLIPVLDMRLLRPYSEDFAIQVQKLSWVYQGWRKVRGDGNCYYRAVAVAFCEYLESEASGEEASERIGLMKKQEGVFALRRGYDSSPILTFLESLRNRKGSVEGVSATVLALKDEDLDRHLVQYMRMIAATALEQHSNHPTILPLVPDLSAEVGKILTLGSIANGAVFLALPTALSVTILHECLMSDTKELRTEAMQPLTPHTDTPKLSLCYRPGHYDLLCALPREFSFENQYDRFSVNFAI